LVSSVFLFRREALNNNLGREEQRFAEQNMTISGVVIGLKVREPPADVDELLLVGVGQRLHPEQRKKAIRYILEGLNPLLIKHWGKY